jgi:microsomal dipeptidase-like Zn-dependent dipeptidase
MERHETVEDARRAYDQAIDGILDIRHRTVVETKSDLDTPGPKAVLHIEGLNTVVTDDDLPKLTNLWEKGVRSLGSIYAHEDTIGGGNEADPSIGLKPMGESIVLEAMRLGMAIDLAHRNRKTKDDVLDVVAKHGKGCVTYTHGSLFDSNNPSLRERAIEESQVREILSVGGLIGLSVCKPFVTSVEDFVAKLITVGELSGFDGVSIGTDFGGVSNDGLLSGMRCYREMYDTIGKHLTDHPGVNDDEIAKIFGENIFSFTHRMLPK